MALAKSIISKKMEAFDKLKELLKSNLGYIGKFTEYLINENIPYLELENLYKNLIDLKKKQKPIDISDLNYEGVVDKIQKYKNDISVNSLISQFPSEQKKIARDLSNNNTGYNLLLKASNSPKLDILITKISRYHSKEELRTALTLFSKESINDEEKIKEYLKESKSEIVYDKEDIMIIKVNSILDVQKLGSDTSWCILGQSMWARYTNGRYQYILYDFSKDDWDPKFKIGFTLNKDFTVHAAHDILDSGCSSYLNDIMISNDIKYSQLIPKSESINLTNDMISNLKRNASVAILRQYSDSTKIEQIPIFLKKLFEISTKDGDISLGESKIDIVKNCLNRYFSDKNYVTFDDLKAVHTRLPYMIRNLQLKNSEILKRKVVTDKPIFNERELDPSISVSMLDIWKKEDLVKAFGSQITSLIKIPGASWLYSGEEFKFTNEWNKEKIEAISNKVNEIYKDGIWKTSFDGNKYQLSSFIENYVVLNYALDRSNLVDKSAINLLREDDKIENAYLLKMPIDLSKSQNMIRSLNKWAIPLIIKKDYDDKFIHIESMRNIISLVDHLLEHKLKFKLSKTNFGTYTRLPMKLESPGAKIMSDLINKFKVKKKVGDKVETEDGKISIELF